MEIVLSMNNRERIATIPIPPLDLEVSISQDNTDFEGLENKVRLIGNSDLTKIKFSSFFPNQKIKSAHKNAFKNGWDYVDFIEEARKRKIPIRIVIIFRKKKINMAATIDDFNYSIDKAGDIKYSISLTEYLILTPLKNELDFGVGYESCFKAQ